MIPVDISGYILKLKDRYKYLEDRLAEPDIYTNQTEFKVITKEHQKLSTLFSLYDEWLKVSKDIRDNEQLMEIETDEEMLSLLKNDIVTLYTKLDNLEKKIKIYLIPPNSNDDRNIIVEIRPAAGGDEAALFAGELYRAYCKFAESKGWKNELLDFSSGNVGGIKEVIFSLSGENVYSYMKYESGVHRVQRIPETETGGRIHTSTITVAILPEAEEVEIDIKVEDLRFDYFRSSGPGGQNVNRTDSAVRVTHIPTGISVASQQEKSQHRNKATALRILRAKLLEIQQRQEMAKLAESKREQVGTGDRSERIRTYNFPQNRVTDHRYGVSVHNIEGIMNGDFEELFEQIMVIESKKAIEKLISE